MINKLGENMPKINRKYKKKTEDLLVVFSKEWEMGQIQVRAGETEHFVATERDAIMVWFSISPHTNIYGEQYRDEDCFVSDMIPVPGGFKFKTKMDNPCIVSYFVNEKEDE